ncbi:MAG: hypothetical protein ACTHLN_14625 [Tepidisphaeraceae bacterium]
MNPVDRPPLWLKPNLKPRRLAFWLLLSVFVIWVGFLAWIYLSQVYFKHHM